MDDKQHAEFIEELEKEGRQDFHLTIRGKEEIQLTTKEISGAVYNLVNAKAEALAGAKPYFSIELNTDFS